MLLNAPTGTNETYGLLEREPKNVNVRTSGRSVVSDCIRCRFENVPKRDSATISPQRCIPQYGQPSEPMYSTAGLPLSVSAGWLLRIAGPASAICLLPSAFVAAASMADDGMLVTALVTRCVS